MPCAVGASGAVLRTRTVVAPLGCLAETIVAALGCLTDTIFASLRGRGKAIVASLGCLAETIVAALGRLTDALFASLRGRGKAIVAPLGCLAETIVAALGRRSNPVVMTPFAVSRAALTLARCVMMGACRAVRRFATRAAAGRSEVAFRFMAGNRLDRDRLPGKAFDFADLHAFAGVDQRNGRALTAGTTGAADPVHVIFGELR